MKDTHFQKNSLLNEAVDPVSMTAKQLAAAGITSVKGLGGVDIDVNSSGFLINPAKHLPSGVLDKLKSAWASSNGDVNTFYSQNIDGTSVKDMLSQCPSQQSFGIAKELGLPNGTDVPCVKFTDNSCTAIKFNEGSTTAGGSANDAVTNSAVASGASGSDAAASGASAGTDAGATSGADATGVDAGNGGIGAGAGNWWAFFGTKEFLIGAVAVGGIIALIKTLGTTIKARFRKCAKVIYRMQKDFGTAENGMDMKAVLPGVGSKITDWATRLFGAKRGAGKNKGALGLRPFVDNYRNELSADLNEAKKAFNIIATAGKNQEESSGAMNNLQKESQEIVYSSFAEMFKMSPVNESKNLNEAVGLLSAIGGLIALGSLGYAAGKFIIKKKNEKDAKAEAVQVTKQSTREVCYSILNMFFSKYFNMEEVSKKLGMDIGSLGDINSSNVDKFTKLTKAMKQENAEGKVSKMFTRVQKNYNEMIDAYLRIANTVVNNFEKYTKQRKGLDGKVKELSEKDANLLVASVEKLKAEIKRQEDGYRNNFFRVMNAIVASKEYTDYIDFIIEKVMPVFKSGLASDADYVLDTAPKAGEYYIIHQTSESNEADPTKGNVVLARVIGFDQTGSKEHAPIIKFARVALLKTAPTKKDDKYDLSGYDESNLDRTAFGKAKGENADTSQKGDAVKLEYTKWLMLNPVIAVNVPGEEQDGEDIDRTKLYHKTLKTADGREIDEYIFGVSTKVKEQTAETYNADTNISEADGTPDISGEQGEELPENNPQQTIVKLICANINKGTDLGADVKTNQFTGAQIFLGTKCTPKEVDEKLKALGFEVLTGKIKEKEQIEKNITGNLGYVHVSQLNINDISKIEDAVKAIENRQLTGEKILSNIDKIANGILQDVQKLNLSPAALTYPLSLTGNNSKPVFYTLPKVGKNPYYKNYDTGIKNTDRDGKNIGIHWYPALLDNSGNLIVPSQNKQNNTVNDSSTNSSKPAPQEQQGQQPQQTQQAQQLSQGILGIVLTIDDIVNRQPSIKYHPAKLDIESIKKAIVAVEEDFENYNIIEPIRGRNTAKGQAESTATAESFSIEYDNKFNMSESFMSSFGYPNSNKIRVNRTIKGPKSKFVYYALSENAWGDGSKLDPQKYLEESLDTILSKCNTIDDFTATAKNSHSINFIKINEDCSYNTAFPVNRYHMLTASNPLYEGLAIVRFDKRGNLTEVIKTGVKKIYCESN